MNEKRQLPIAIDDHWKSLGTNNDPHCHEWQHGSHIEKMPREKNDPYQSEFQLPEIIK